MLELARPDDRLAINAICRQAHALHTVWRPDLYYMADELYDEQRLLECIRDRQIYVARIHGAVLGYIQFRIRNIDSPGSVPHRCFVLDVIAVEESCRGQGIGSEMMVDAHALAKAFGCTDMQLSVYPENEAGMALYRKFGFTIRNINMLRKV